MKPTCEKFEYLLSMLIDREPLTVVQQQRLQKHLKSCLRCKNKAAELDKVDYFIKTALSQKFNEHIPAEMMGIWVAQQPMDEMDRLTIQSHLKKCAFCREKLEWLRFLDLEKTEFKINTNPAIRTDILQTIKIRLLQFYDGIKSFFQSRASQWTLAVAFSVCCLFAIYLMKQNLLTRHSEFTDIQIKQQSPIPNQRAQTDSEKIQNLEDNEDEKSSAFLASNFQPLPYMEEMIDSQFRSEEIQILSPSAGAIFKSAEKIEFKWISRNPDLKIKIMDNRNTVVHADLAHGEYLYQSSLTPGLYYWKLETEEDLLFIGKFFVRD